jgi:hypothetical protein
VALGCQDWETRLARTALSRGFESSLGQIAQIRMRALAHTQSDGKRFRNWLSRTKAYTYEGETLISMLDEALAGSRPHIL